MIAFPFSMRWSFASALCLSTALTAHTATDAVAQSTASNSSRNSAIQAALEKAVAEHEVAGAVTLVVDDKGPIELNTAGFANIESKTPMTKDTMFWIASMSKPVTAVAVMTLVDEGKLSLDDDISKHLPAMKELRDSNGNPVHITIQNVLNHTSGMSELPSDSVYTAVNLEEAAAKYAKLPVRFEPGSKWEYSQTGINTAARIVEVVSGQTFDAYVAERIFKPLGMIDTGFYLNDEQYKRLAKSYSRAENGTLTESPIWLLAGKLPTDRNRFPAANGGLFSTASDYGRFCTMLINDGTLDGHQIISAKSALRLRSPTMDGLKTGFTEGNTWGVGVCIVKTPQGASRDLSAGSYGHGGAYGTQAWIDPVKKRAYLLMVQRSNYPNADDSNLRKAFTEAATREPTRGNANSVPRSSRA